MRFSKNGVGVGVGLERISMTLSDVANAALLLRACGSALIEVA